MSNFFDIGNLREELSKAIVKHDTSGNGVIFYKGNAAFVATFDKEETEYLMDQLDATENEKLKSQKRDLVKLRVIYNLLCNFFEQCKENKVEGMRESFHGMIDDAKEKSASVRMVANELIKISEKYETVDNEETAIQALSEVFEALKEGIHKKHQNEKKENDNG